MMRNVPVMVWFVWTLLACGETANDDNACPAGTHPMEMENLPGVRDRICQRPGGKAHGPVVSTGRDGHERRIGQWREGKMHGRWFGYWDGRLIGVRDFVDGELRSMVGEGPDGIGQVQFVTGWKGGFAHGVFVLWMNTPKQLVGAHVEGRRSGLWRRSGTVSETRIYDDRGILRSLDGAPVPPPPDEIELPDGRTLRRAGCELATEANFWVFSCVDLFEAFQRCALGPTTATACHERAIAEYLKFNRAG